MKHPAAVSLTPPALRLYLKQGWEMSGSVFFQLLS